MQAFIALRLDRYGGTVAHFLKAVRCQLPAGVAVDTGRIDKKVALDICVETLFWIRHCMKPRSAKPFASASPLPPPAHTWYRNRPSTFERCARRETSGRPVHRTRGDGRPQLAVNTKSSIG